MKNKIHTYFPLRRLIFFIGGIYILTSPVKPIEPITLSTLGLTGAAATAAVKGGLHCQLICTKQICQQDETKMFGDAAQHFVERIENLTNKGLSQHSGFARLCAEFCTSGQDEIEFEVGDAPDKKKVKIKVLKRYKGVGSIKQCVAGFNDSLPNENKSTRLKPFEEVSIYSQKEFDLLKMFEKNNDFDGYLKWFSENLEFQTNFAWK